MLDQKLTQDYQEAEFFAELIKAYRSAKPLMLEVAPYVADAQALIQALRFTGRLSPDVSPHVIDIYDRAGRCLEVLSMIATSYHRAARALLEVAESAAEVHDE